MIRWITLSDLRDMRQFIQPELFWSDHLAPNLYPTEHALRYHAGQVRRVGRGLRVGVRVLDGAAVLPRWLWVGLFIMMLGAHYVSDQDDLVRENDPQAFSTQSIVLFKLAEVFFTMGLMLSLHAYRTWSQQTRQQRRVLTPELFNIERHYFSLMHAHCQKLGHRVEEIQQALETPQTEDEVKLFLSHHLAVLQHLNVKAEYDVIQEILYFISRMTSPPNFDLGANLLMLYVEQLDEQKLLAPRLADLLQSPMRGKRTEKVVGHVMCAILNRTVKPTQHALRMEHNVDAFTQLLGVDRVRIMHALVEAGTPLAHEALCQLIYANSAESLLAHIKQYRTAHRTALSQDGAWHIFIGNGDADRLHRIASLLCEKNEMVLIREIVTQLINQAGAETRQSYVPLTFDGKPKPKRAATDAHQIELQKSAQRFFFALTSAVCARVLSQLSSKQQTFLLTGSEKVGLGDWVQLLIGEPYILLASAFAALKAAMAGDAFNGVLVETCVHFFIKHAEYLFGTTDGLYAQKHFPYQKNESQRMQSNKIWLLSALLTAWSRTKRSIDETQYWVVALMPAYSAIWFYRLYAALLKTGKDADRIMLSILSSYQDDIQFTEQPAWQLNLSSDDFQTQSNFLDLIVAVFLQQQPITESLAKNLPNEVADRNAVIGTLIKAWYRSQPESPDVKFNEIHLLIKKLLGENFNAQNAFACLPSLHAVFQSVGCTIEPHSLYLELGVHLLFKTNPEEKSAMVYFDAFLMATPDQIHFAMQNTRAMLAVASFSILASDKAIPGLTRLVILFLNQTPVNADEMKTFSEHTLRLPIACLHKFDASLQAVSTQVDAMQCQAARLRLVVFLLYARYVRWCDEKQKMQRFGMGLGYRRRDRDTLISLQNDLGGILNTAQTTWSEPVLKQAFLDCFFELNVYQGLMRHQQQGAFPFSPPHRDLSTESLNGLSTKNV